MVAAGSESTPGKAPGPRGAQGGQPSGRQRKTCVLSKEGTGAGEEYERRPGQTVGGGRGPMGAGVEIHRDGLDPGRHGGSGGGGKSS